MFRELYEWIQDISIYLVLTAAVLYALPGAEYKKYIRFFTGMVLILMILTPVFRLLGTEDQVTNFYKSREYEEKISEIENATEYLYGIDTEESLKKAENILEEEINDSENYTDTDDTKEEKNGSVKVEEIQID